jgi:LDH2 family malate/lactate/ureidoglycolate dehydrogenase
MPVNMPGEGLGHFLGAMRIDGFRPAAEFCHHMDKWIRRFRSATPINPHQPVLVPGDPERSAEAWRRKHGIPLPDAVHNDLLQLQETTGQSL